MKNYKTMTEKEILIEAKTQNIKTQEMLVELLEKWYNKDYYLTDEEWDTIKYWKTFLDSIFNDVQTLKDSIELNKSDLKELTK
jgi:DNA-binding transcriptional regulator WhiA